MLNISPVSNIRNNYIYKNNKISFVPKLRPLAHDSVSFSGARSLNQGLLEAFNNQEVCKSVYENAELPESNLKKILKQAFRDITVSGINPDGIVASYAVRRKTAESIREKAASKFEEAIYRNDKNNFVNLNDINGIKHLVKDIIGARIVVNQSDTDINSQIMDRLIELVKKGELKIKGIEIIMPDTDENIEPYFNIDDIERLKDAVNENSTDKIEIARPLSKSGYSALHLDVDLTDDNMPLKNAGYDGEIQIIGPDVAYFKDLEDCCYKVKQNKKIKAGHPAYYPFVKHLNRYLLDENGKTIKEHAELFDEYTYRAYIIQRKKDPKTDPKYDRTHLPSLAECGFKHIIPPEFDFNYLKKIKEYCDRIYTLTNIRNDKN